ncbi:unnamed protein product, partial [Pylaiella littoralis]
AKQDRSHANRPQRLLGSSPGCSNPRWVEIEAALHSDGVYCRRPYRCSNRPPMSA